jgi:CHASE2 domain-containing sensor protein
MEAIVGIVMLLAMGVGVLLVIACYFLPVIIAFARGHRQAVPITLVCIFLGWSFIGWVVALIWSFTNPPAPVVVQQFAQPQQPYRQG